jgi:uncharacterized protein with NAD-binding domain and iron-sulfur cluster
VSQIRVAILGGGVGAITAAYYLSEPGLDYQVTVYQQGFRLGGKCATSRGPYDRIEEHGLHMLMGYYERTFAMLRPVFESWRAKYGQDPQHPFQTFDDAFQPVHELTVMEQVDGSWLPWTIKLPQRAGQPGLAAGGAPAPFSALVAGLRAFIRLLRDLVAAGVPTGTRRLVSLIKFASVVLKGMLIDIPDGNFDKLDQLEIRDWLQLHGLSEELSEWVPVRLIYDLGFAYSNGDSSSVKNGRAGAGVTLRVLLRCLLGYREAPLYRMKAGMADTVFTPLYRVLRDRGVKFEFFHRVTKLSLSASGQQVQRVSLERQAHVSKGEYVPIQAGRDGIERWPSEPDWSQLQGAKLDQSFEGTVPSLRGEARELNLGDDFDHVVLGISLGGLPGLSPDLEARADWQGMLAGMTTVKTQAAQLWFQKPPTGPLDGGLFTAFAGPFNTACDMSELLPREGWPADNPPQALHYLVSSLPDNGAADFTDAQRMRENAFWWLYNEAGQLWPRLADAQLYHPDPLASDEERRAFQFIKVNHNPSDRYVQSFPGSMDKRLPSKLPGIDNLALAGDWVRTGLSVGCVESAVQGGIQAANAVRGVGPLRVD